MAKKEIVHSPLRDCGFRKHKTSQNKNKITCNRCQGMIENNYRRWETLNETQKESIRTSFRA